MEDMAHPNRLKPDRAGARSSRAGFTLLEILMVVAVIILLVGLLLPALSSARESARSLVCSSNLRTVTAEFGMFADGSAPNGRGESEALGGRRFRINDFQESLYGLDEFWDLGSRETGKVAGDAGVMLCPTGAATLTKRQGYPCGGAAMAPIEGVSVALNMRLYRAVTEFKGKPVLAPAAATFVRTDVLQHPYVPLVLDVDGAEAVRRTLEPFYTAPGIAAGADDPYADSRYWLGANRHRRKINVGFVGGQVLSSTDPAKERWDWEYQGEVGR